MFYTTRTRRRPDRTRQVPSLIQGLYISDTPWKNPSTDIYKTSTRSYTALKYLSTNPKATLVNFLPKSYLRFLTFAKRKVFPIIFSLQSFIYTFASFKIYLKENISNFLRFKTTQLCTLKLEKEKSHRLAYRPLSCKLSVLIDTGYLQMISERCEIDHNLHIYIYFSAVYISYTVGKANFKYNSLYMWTYTTGTEKNRIA